MLTFEMRMCVTAQLFLRCIVVWRRRINPLHCKLFFEGVGTFISLSSASLTRCLTRIKRNRKQSRDVTGFKDDVSETQGSVRLGLPAELAELAVLAVHVRFPRRSEASLPT